MDNRYDDPAYAGIISGLKSELKELRASYDPGDVDNPEIQKIIDENWDKQEENVGGSNQ